MEFKQTFLKQIRTDVDTICQTASTTSLPDSIQYNDDERKTIEAEVEQTLTRFNLKSFLTTLEEVLKARLAQTLTSKFNELEAPSTEVIDALCKTIITTAEEIIRNHETRQINSFSPYLLSLIIATIHHQVEATTLHNMLSTRVLSLSDTDDQAPSEEEIDAKSHAAQQHEQSNQHAKKMQHLLAELKVHLQRILEKEDKNTRALRVDIHNSHIDTLEHLIGQIQQFEKDSTNLEAIQAFVSHSLTPVLTGKGSHEAWIQTLKQRRTPVWTAFVEAVKRFIDAIMTFFTSKQATASAPPITVEDKDPSVADDGAIQPPKPPRFTYSRIFYVEKGLATAEQIKHLSAPQG